VHKGDCLNAHLLQRKTSLGIPRKDIKTQVSDQLRPVHSICKEDIPNPMSSLEELTWCPVNSLFFFFLIPLYIFLIYSVSINKVFAGLHQCRTSI
jgi:hypothetical protein